MSDDSSVSIGGNVNLTNSAIAGRDATVTNITEPTSLDELRTALAQLRHDIEAADDELPDQEEVLDTVTQAEEEVAKESPNRRLVQGMLATIGQAVVGVGALATTATAIHDAAGVILG